MKIIYRPDESGEKIPFEINGNKVTFDDELTLNLSRYERDDPAHIDVCRDKFGNLVTGVIPGVAESYVAQLDIPAREYVEVPDPDYTPASEDDGEEHTKPEPVPFNLDKCTMTLFTLV